MVIVNVVDSCIYKEQKNNFKLFFTLLFEHDWRKVGCGLVLIPACLFAHELDGLGIWLPFFTKCCYLTTPFFTTNL
jgi:hypothetical protein